MSQAGTFFVRGLDTGGGWFEDAARRQAAMREFEAAQQIRRQQLAEQEGYHAALIQQAQQKAQQELAQRQAAAEFTGGYTGQPVDPNVPLSMQGQAIGQAISQQKASALDAVKESVKQQKIVRLSKQIPALIDEIEKRSPNDPVRGPLITKLMKAMDEAMVLDMEAPELPKFAAKQGNVLNLETARKRVRDAEIELLNDRDADPRVRDLRRQKLDDARRQHVLGLTGQDPGSFYSGEGLLRMYPDKAEARARTAYEDAVRQIESGQLPGAGDAPPTPAAPAPVIQQAQIEVNPAELEQIKALRAKGVDAKTAIQTVLKSRQGNQP